MAMQLSEKDYEIISECLPKQRGNVTHDNLRVLNGILYVLENGCKWRALPKEFGYWHTVYLRMNRWSKNGVLHRLFECLQRKGMMHITITVMSLDSTSIRVHPDGAGALKKTVRSRSVAPGVGLPPSFIWLLRTPAAPSSSASPAGRRATRRTGGS